jgi:hypothetical protein
MNRCRCRRGMLLMVWFATVGIALPPRATSAPLERTTTERADDSPGSQIHVMYVLPSDGIDEKLDTNGVLATSVTAFQSWLGSQTEGRHLRLDTYQGNLDITFVRLSRTDAQIRSYNAFVRDQIEQELRAAGFDRPNKVYAVYYGGSSNYACGGGAWPPTLTGNVAALYLRGAPPGAAPCATNRFASSQEMPGYWEFARIHEILHTLGFVAQCASHHTLSGHVSDDPRDLMYAGPLPWQPSILDIGHDDYFQYNRPGCLDLAKSPFLEPSSWPSTRTELQAHDCAEISALRARDATVPTSIRFINRSSQVVRVYWLDYGGQRRLYATLQPGQDSTQGTFLTHPWLVTLGDQCRSIYLPIEQPSQATIR